MDKGLPHLKQWGIAVPYCWYYEPPKLLLRFIDYRLDHLKNKHTKIAVNSTVQFFENYYQKKCLVKVWSFSAQPPQNDSPLKFLQKVNRNNLFMTNIFKLHEHHTFGLMKMDNMKKTWFITINESLKMLFFNC